MLTRSQQAKMRLAARGGRLVSTGATLSLLACSNVCQKPESCVSLHCSAEIQDSAAEWSFDQVSFASDVVVSDSSRPAAGRCYISIPPVTVNADRSSKTPSHCDLPVKVMCAPGQKDQLPDAASPSLLYALSFRLPDPFYLSPSETVRTLSVESNEWHESGVEDQILTDGSTPVDASGPTLVDAPPPGENPPAADATGSGKPCWIRRTGAASMTIEESTGTSASTFRRVLRIDLDTAGWTAGSADASCTGQAWMRASVRLVQTSSNRVVEEGPCPWSRCE